MSKSTKSSGPGGETAGELTFEKALAELEKVVALAAHQRGLELARFCQARLEAAQQQIQVLEGDVLKRLAAAPAADDDGE
jgi:exodeoxyribonuclease VII small subunit